MKTSRQHLDLTSFASAVTKVTMGINRQKAGKFNMKSTRQKQKMTDLKNKDSVGKLLQALPSPTQPSSVTQVMTTDPFRMEVKDPALGSGQFLSPQKFKLQLFPINEITRNALLEGNHNPYLELTLRPRKKISSVVKHLNVKWGISRKTSSELMLFPYEAQAKSTVDNRKWTLKDTETSAADVFIAVGQPEVFRLRYGWSPDIETETFQNSPAPFVSEDSLQLEEDKNIKTNEEEKQPSLLVTQEIGPVSANEIVNSSSYKALLTDESVKIVQNLGMGSSTLLSWFDCMTNTSMGQLLCETPGANLSNPLPSEQNPSFKQISLNCDSFDAAIADLIARNQRSHHSTQALHSSIWEDEETRHAFPLQEASSSRNDDASTSCGQSPTKDHASQRPAVDLKSDLQDDACRVPANSQSQTQVQHNDLSNLGLSNFCWGDSLGPFEFGIPSKHITGGDSISLSGLIANSLDAFQNC